LQDQLGKGGKALQDRKVVLAEVGRIRIRPDPEPAGAE